MALVSSAFFVEDRIGNINFFIEKLQIAPREERKDELAKDKFCERAEENDTTLIKL